MKLLASVVCNYGHVMPTLHTTTCNGHSARSKHKMWNAFCSADAIFFQMKTWFKCLFIVVLILNDTSADPFRWNESDFFSAMFGRIMKNITNVLNVQFHSSAALFFIQTILLLSYLIKSFELNFEHILLLFEHSFNMDISRSYTIAFMGLHLESEAGAFCALTNRFENGFIWNGLNLLNVIIIRMVDVCVLCCAVCSVRPKRDSLKTS